MSAKNPYIFVLGNVWVKCLVWSLQGTSVGMEYYGKGIGPGGGGQFSMAQQNFIPGPVGDGMPNNMWNPQMKGQVSEASDKVVNTVLISLWVNDVKLNFNLLEQD